MILFSGFNNGELKALLWPLLLCLGGIPVRPLDSSRGKEIAKNSGSLEYILFELILKCELLSRILQLCGFLLR